MTKEKEAVLEAISKLKKMGARELVNKERIEGELAALKKKLTGLEADLEAAMDAGSDDVATEILVLKRELQGQVDGKTQELALVETAYQQALTEIKELQKLPGELEKAQNRAVVDGALHKDPFSRDATDVALENVRGHIAELDAQVSLNRELAGEAQRNERKTAELDQKLSEIKAKEELARLKAARGKKPKSESESASDPSEGDDSAAQTSEGDKPKRTL